MHFIISAFVENHDCPIIIGSANSLYDARNMAGNYKATNNVLFFKCALVQMGELMPEDAWMDLVL